MTENGSFPVRISIVISIIIVILAILHLLSPSSVDTIIILLIAIMVIIWLPNLKSIEFPGGVKVELVDVETNAEEVIGDKKPTPDEKETKIYEEIFEINPNLSLVYFRIQVELRIRELAEKNNIPIRGLQHTLRVLQRNGIIPAEVSVHGLYELIDFGNKAAHGIEVEREAAEFILDAGPKIIAILDELL